MTPTDDELREIFAAKLQAAGATDTAERVRSKMDLRGYNILTGALNALKAVRDMASSAMTLSADTTTATLEIIARTHERKGNEISAEAVRQLKPYDMQMLEPYEREWVAPIETALVALGHRPFGVYIERDPHVMACAKALATHHYSKRFRASASEQIVQTNVEANWGSYLETALIVLNTPHKLEG